MPIPKTEASLDVVEDGELQAELSEEEEEAAEAAEEEKLLAEEEVTQEKLAGAKLEELREWPLQVGWRDVKVGSGGVQNWSAARKSSQSDEIMMGGGV